MRRVRLTSPAQTDYFETIAWYAEHQPELATKFEKELENLFERIKRDPEIFSKFTPTVSKARMPKFKYGIYFTIEHDEIGVLAIYHPSRNPDALRFRLK